MKKEICLILFLISSFFNFKGKGNFEREFSNYPDFDSHQHQECSIAPSCGGWTILGVIVGAALGIALTRQAHSLIQDRIEKRKQKKVFQQQQKAHFTILYLETLYKVELEEELPGILNELPSSPNKMHAKPTKETIEKLKKDIAELRESLEYLAGEEYEEAADLLAKLNTLYTLYMKLFGEPALQAHAHQS